METSEGVNFNLGNRDSLRQNYLGKGFCLSPPLLTKQELARANHAVSRVLAGRYTTGIAPPYRNWEPGTPKPSVIKIDDAHVCDEDLYEVVTSRPLAEFLYTVIDADLIQVWTLELLVKPPEPQLPGKSDGVIGWHQDARFWTGWSGETFTAWLALVDVDASMGAVRFVEESHTWGMIDDARFFLHPDLDAQKKTIARATEGAWRETIAELPAGAVSVHDRSTLHGSGPNSSHRTRVGIAVHLRTDRASLRLVENNYFRPLDLDNQDTCPTIWPPGELG